MRLLWIMLCLVLLTGCASAPAQMPSISPETEPSPVTEAATVPTEPKPTQPPKDPLTVLLESLTIEERVGQLFLARCTSETALQDAEAYHLGGFMLFSQDFENQTPDSLRATLDGYQAAANVSLLLAVDEEGGTVTRISRYPAFRSSRFPSPRTAFDQGGMEGAWDNEWEKCEFLRSLGLNVNLGPVCDISTDPGGFMYQRSLGQDPDTTAKFVSGTVDRMAQNRIGSVLKHFPGYGNNADTHVGIAADGRSLDELEEADLKPFAAGISAGADAVLVSHTIVEALDAENPASLSPAVHDYLRNVMGFSGVIMTDDLVMEAITDRYGAAEAAVQAILAGNDLLCSTEYAIQYEAVLAAVLDGRIDFDTLNNAARRVLQWKQELGLLS